MPADKREADTIYGFGEPHAIEDLLHPILQGLAFQVVKAPMEAKVLPARVPKEERPLVGGHETDHAPQRR